MTVKRIMLTASAALALATWAGTLPASAQYYDDGYRGRGRDYGYDRRDDYDDDRYERRRFRRFGGGGGGGICVTARGNCAAPPAPYNAPCGCEIPGFGYKRGAIGG